MYKIIAQELVGYGDSLRFIGKAKECRFCATSEHSFFGKKRNAHAFPEGLGNKSLFLLNECTSCNSKFSVYEDALCKAVGPYLTLGGISGKNGVRQTGRSISESVLKHETREGKRHIAIEVKGVDDFSSVISRKNEIINLRIPVIGDKFVPRYAYKALLKIALSLVPDSELHLYKQSLDCLQTKNEPPGDHPLQVWFSYASIGNAPPTIACVVLRRTDHSLPVPYTIAFFLAGSVCFQITLRSEQKDMHVPVVGRFNISWTSSLAKPEGGYHPIKYSSPIEFDWSDLTPRLQPFEAFELTINTISSQGEYSPIYRDNVQYYVKKRIIG